MGTKATTGSRHKQIFIVVSTAYIKYWAYTIQSPQTTTQMANVIHTHAIYTYYAWCTRSGWPRVSFINGMRQVEFLTRLNPYTYALKEDFGSVKILHCISESLYRSFQHFDSSLIWIMVSSVALRFNFLLQLTGHQERESHSDYL